MSKEELKTSNRKALYDKVRKTAASRFNASRRLQYHNKASLWTISLFSLGLIFVSLLQALEFSLPYSDKAINLGQVVLSMAILLISVITTMNNYGIRAEKFHACGLELAEIELKLAGITEETIDNYDIFAKQYIEILRRYENHENIDYTMMKLRKPEYYKLSKVQAITAYTNYMLHYILYLILLLLEAVWLYALFSQISFIKP